MRPSQFVHASILEFFSQRRRADNIGEANGQRHPIVARPFCKARCARLAACGFYKHLEITLAVGRALHRLNLRGEAKALDWFGKRHLYSARTIEQLLALITQQFHIIVRNWVAVGTNEEPHQFNGSGQRVALSMRLNKLLEVESRLVAGLLSFVLIVKD